MISTTDTTPIAENIKKIKNRIEKAALSSGRNPEEIKLIAVSKQFDAKNIIDAFNAGLKSFGENYPQEFRDKYKLLGDLNKEIEWHFIGHLQKNKIKYVIGKTALIHSLDSTSLAEELNKKAIKQDEKVNVLVEINSGDEKSKTGVSFDESKVFLEKICLLDHIDVKGFMTMPPYFENSENARPYFRTLRQFRDSVVDRYPDAKELSMGMSGDFEVAIEEGATYVRLGTAIFGSRQY